MIGRFLEFGELFFETSSAKICKTTKFSSGVLFIIFTMTVLATLNDYLESPVMSSFFKPNESVVPNESQEKNKEKQFENSKDGLLNQVFYCFSAKRNIKSLFSLKDGTDEIKCLHGLKALSTLLLFVSLKLISMGRIPYSNRNKLTEFFNSPFSVFLRTSFLYEDVFLVASGLLSTLSLLKIVSSGGKVFWLKKILARFLRLVLPLLIVLLFYAYVWEHLGTGPQWAAVVDKNADLCKTNMWKNLFFIQNFYPFEDMVSLSFYL